MLDIDATDEQAVAEGLPDIDGYNMWPLLSGEVDTSPRTELVISGTVFISGDYKLNVGNTQYAIWQGIYLIISISLISDPLILCFYSLNVHLYAVRLTRNVLYIY